MPWIPELFSAGTLQQLEEKMRREELATVPYFDGLMAEEPDALIESFAGEPELHDPERGRIRGTRAFRAYAAWMNGMLNRQNVSVENVSQVSTERGGFGEAVLHVHGERGQVALPVAIVAEKRDDGRIIELRLYSSSWPLTGRHAHRSPLLQGDPELQTPDVVAEYQRALSAGDVDAILATFERDGYAREPAGAEYTHRGRDGLRAFYELLFSNDGGIPLEHCTLADDGHACALEYNVVRWGKTELRPEAGVAVYVRGQSGKLAAARIYDDCEPPLG